MRKCPSCFQTFEMTEKVSACPACGKSLKAEALPKTPEHLEPARGTVEGANADALALSEVQTYYLALVQRHNQAGKQLEELGAKIEALVERFGGKG